MAGSKFLCLCGYCGIKWVDEEQHSWRSTPRKCWKCGETKRIAAQQLPKEGLDVFGYRFSPPFPPKENQYGTHQYLD